MRRKWIFLDTRPQYTQDVMEGGCGEIYPPPAASELALPSDNSKHDCTGEKFILVPEYLTERDE